MCKIASRAPVCFITDFVHTIIITLICQTSAAVMCNVDVWGSNKGIYYFYSYILPLTIKNIGDI